MDLPHVYESGPKAPEPEEPPKKERKDYTEKDLAELPINERIRATAERHAMKAINVLIGTLDDEDATETERRGAAREILQLAFGKKMEGLTPETRDEQEPYEKIAEMIQSAKYARQAQEGDISEASSESP